VIPYTWLEAAAQRIAPHIRSTPLTYDADHDLYLKWENLQVTGSFKARGALNKILALQDWERQRGLVAASAGNHGQGVALAAQLTGAQTTIFASDHAVPAKLEAMRKLGAEVRLVPGGYDLAEKTAIEYAAATGATWVSPYNDGQIIAGQGTLALEILAERPELAQAAWIVPTGGGGLAAGVGAVLKSAPGAGQSEAHLVAAQSEASPFLHALYHRGAQDGIIERDSLADGLSGPVEQGAVTIALARQYLDDFVLVTEAEIIEAIACAWKWYHQRIEGSAAVALAAALTRKIAFRPAVIIVSGGNIQPEVHEKIIRD
jgi:threonine dehydratase